MTSLTNPVGSQNIVDRFADYVVATGNSGIVWGTNAVPTVSTGPVSAGTTDVLEVVASSEFGGSTSGKAIGIDGSSIYNDPIKASTIYNALLAETNAYTRIRLVRGILNVTGAGGNSGTRLLTAAWPNPGPAPLNPPISTLYDSTQMSNMNTGYLQSVGTPSAGNVSSGNIISVGDLQTMFSNLQSALSAVRGNTVTIQVDVCHASCHSSCHSSRGRR